MAFDAEEIATRAREHITDQGENDVGFTLPRIMALIPEALNVLGLRVADSDDREEFRVTLTNGTGLTLSAGVALITDDSVILKSIPGGGSVTVTAGGTTTPAKPVPKYDSLFADEVMGTDLFHYALLGTALHFKDMTSGVVDTLPGGATVSVVASRIPTLGQINGRFQKQAVEILADLTVQRLRTPSKRAPAQTANA